MGLVLTYPRRLQNELRKIAGRSIVEHRHKRLVGLVDARHRLLNSVRVFETPEEKQNRQALASLRMVDAAMRQILLDNQKIVR